MSGFFGMIRQDGKPVDERFLEKIAEKLSFRGSDGTSVWARANVGGCFALMRTGPAPQAAQQPVIWQNRYWLWGDIRLDGRRELLERLGEIQHGADAEFTSEELLLRAWEKWGEGSLERVIGDFSFALWDAKEEILWGARDFVGPRPFYYASVQEVFCFSNTLDILRSVPEISGELDEVFLGDFLVEGWNVEPARTVYRDIRRVVPGHVLKFSRAGIAVRCFRKLPIEEPLRWKSREDYVERYREVLRMAVSDRLPERATALYLSGGLDSSSVCAVAAQLAGQSGHKESLKAFTLSHKAFFDDPEPAIAKITVEYINVRWETLEQAELTPFEGAGTPGWKLPEPGNEVFFASEQRQFQRIAAHSNVVLSGDGGDDVLTGQGWPYLVHLCRKGDWTRIARDFGGYVWTRQRFPPLRGGFRSKLRRLLKPKVSNAGYPEWLNPEFAARTGLRQRWLELRTRKRNHEHPLHPEAYATLHDRYWGEVLEGEDAGWTGVRLETRAPLLDLRMLTFLLRLPPVPWCMNKELSRQAMRGALPLAVTERPKTPLVKDPLEVCAVHWEWASDLPKEAPESLGKFVNWTKWCETSGLFQGSLNWSILRPVSLLYWLKAVENKKRIQ